MKLSSRCGCTTTRPRDVTVRVVGEVLDVTEDAEAGGCPSILPTFAIVLQPSTV